MGVEYFNPPVNDVSPRARMALSLYNLLVIAETKYGDRMEYAPLHLVFVAPRRLVFFISMALAADGLTDYISEHEPVADIQVEQTYHSALNRNFDGFVVVHGCVMSMLVADVDEAMMIPHQLINQVLSMQPENKRK